MTYRDTTVEGTVTYHVGQIIGAVLGGGGIAAAGVAYAVKTFRALNDPRKCDPPIPDQDDEGARFPFQATLGLISRGSVSGRITSLN